MESKLLTGFLTSFDVSLGRFMERLEGKTCPELFLAASLASRLLADGHICVNLKDYAGYSFELPNTQECITAPSFEKWQDNLIRTKVVGEPPSYRPLILDGPFLYLYRYWRYENTLADLIRKRASVQNERIDCDLFLKSIKRLFPETARRDPDWRKVATFASTFKKLCLISGGPGTGKTYLAARIVAVLMEQAKVNPLHIALSAPTGKAAARLQESFRACRDELNLDLPREAFTIHRLLKLLPHSDRTPFSLDNPLPYEVIIVDEASMVDLPLFTKLVEAMKPEAHLILLGDKDQLASVEPGAVFGELCDVAGAGFYSDNFAGHCFRATGQKVPIAEKTHLLSDNIVVLRENFRFPRESALNRISNAVREGDVDSFFTLCENYPGEIIWKPIPSPAALFDLLAEEIHAGYATYLKAADAKEAFEKFQDFRILCAVREGPYGTENLNRLTEHLFRKERLLTFNTPWYERMPIMITKNDYALSLFNGDCGFILRDGNKRGHLAAFFPAEEGKFRSFPPERLPPFEKVYAMTVHKSQGSEFDAVLLILPDRPTPVLTRELLYTAITRARKKITIAASKEIMKYAISRKTERTSGLARYLGG